MTVNILFVLSTLEPAGSETYCVSLAHAWSNKHRIYWISDSLHYGQQNKAMPISAKIFPRGFLNVWQVFQYIREKKISIVHSHSRRSHWVASHAARLARIPHVTTIHQPPPVHFFSKLEPCLGDMTIAVSEEVREHLLKSFPIQPEKIRLIRNGIALPPPTDPRPVDLSAPARVLILGRLTGHRWDTYQFILDVIKRNSTRLPKAHYKIAGRVPEEKRAVIQKQIQELNARIGPSSLELMGWTSNLTSVIRASDVVIGAGRSALESLALEKLVIVVGERAVLGLCNEDIWETCQRTNFGDHQPVKTFDGQKLERALRDALNPQIDRAAFGRWGREQVSTHYNLQEIADDVEAVYQRLLR